MKSALWTRFHGETTAWAVRANEELLAELSPAVAGTVRARRETQVVLYGPTQSGKTTLVLRLLGVADHDFAVVERVLRGGRAAGNSATAVPMRYSRSEDDRWRVGTVDGEALDEDEIISRLRGWREDVEEGAYASTDPVALFIPRRHFISQTPDVRVSVLDLPGSHAAAPRERALVRRITERHLPGASLILLVSRADNLGVFDPKRLGHELEQLRDWMSYPERYRLVTTHSYSSASVQDQWRDGLLSNVEQVQALMAEQFGRFGEIRGQRGFGSIPFYPLEHGTSWEALRNQASSYFAWANQIQHDLLRQLAADINGSADGGRRLDLGRAMAREIHRRHDRLRAEFWAARQLSRSRSGRLEKERERAAAAMDETHDRLLALKGRLARLAQPDEIAMERVAGLRASEPLTNPKKEKDAVRRWLEAAADAVDDQLRSCAPRCKPPSRKRFETLFERLDSYWLDYWPKLADGFIRDVKDGRQLIEEHWLEAFTAAQRWHLLEAERKRRSVLDLLREMTGRQALQAQHSADRAGEAEAERKAWKAMRRDRLRGIAVARRDKVQADRFDEHMRHRHLVEKRRIAAEVRLAGCDRQPALALARLCQLRLTAEVYRNRCESGS